jgi:hypothetical protein
LNINGTDHIDAFPLDNKDGVAAALKGKMPLNGKL